MKFKGLLLGSAAALLAVGGAQAADLPVKAKAVEYVRICSLYGAGFYYIPGTDTCIKLGGYLRAEVALGTNSVYGISNGSPGGARNRLSNYYTWRAREDLNIDTRTATEYGVVRTFFDATFSWTSGSYQGTGSGFGGTAYSSTVAINSAGALVGTTINPTDGGTSGGSLGVYYAFIQFAGFTMGKAVSQFDAPWTNYPGNNIDSLVGGSGTVTGVNQFSYTADFGQGITASFSAEDRAAYYDAGNLNLSSVGAPGGPGAIAGLTLGAVGANAIGGTRSPNLVGMVRVDQAWGLFQASVAAHDNHVAYYGATEPTGHPGDKWGWAAQLALSIKNIPTGAGDVINIQAVYTDGATRYNFQNLAGSTYLMYGTSGTGAYGSVAAVTAPDTVFINGGQQETIKTWGFRGAYTHNWDAYWNTAIYGAYAQAQFGSGAKTFLCGATGVFTAVGGLTACNPDFNIGQVGIITRWTPVKNLTFSGEFNWTHVDQKYAGIVGAAANLAVAKPAAAYELKDQDSFTMLLRAQRNW
ncbi:porin [Bradyrhizobium sp. F1.13.3]|uniref:porin n=1 Tax=Bradyrhizobium sp. F1.13.3 TaxID=3156351 RepID=UPI0033972585